MRPTRRALLGTLAGGVAGLAGCGYRAGGGEFRWRSSTVHGADGLGLDRGTLLVVTRETTTFDFETERWYRGGNVRTLDPRRGEGITEYGFGDAVLTAALGDDVLCVGHVDGAVTAVRARTDTRSSAGPEAGTGEGTEGETATTGPGRWTVAPGVAPSGVGSLAVEEGTVYAGGSGGLAALSSGTVRWRWRDGSVLAVGVGAGETAVYALASDRLVALAPGGSVRWTHGVVPADTGPGSVPPLVGSDGVYLADAGGVTALAHDGSVRWEREVGGPVARPALAPDGLYHASTDGVRAFSLGGRERWVHDLRGPFGPRVAAADGRAFLLAAGELLAVGPGGTAWRAPLDGPEPFTPEFGPFAVEETLVLGGAGEVRGYWQSQLR